MATRIQQFQLIGSEPFQQQIAGSLIAAAANVLNEAADFPNHENRAKWARAILQNPFTQALSLVNYMLTNATIVSEAGNAVGPSGTPVSDSDVDFVVASLFDQMANDFAQSNAGFGL